jgi:dephospho-CoA kinase
MNVKIIGISGGIGSGKSTVTDYLRAKGYKVIDADEISHAVTMTGKPALSEIRDAFGCDSIRADGSLDRKYIADIVFGDSEKLKILNDIIHKYIEAEVNRTLMSARRSARSRIEDNPDDAPVFLAAPLFFEADYHLKTDEVWHISAPDDIRVKRAAARDNTDEQAIIARMARQMAEEERRKRADVIIENNGSQEALYEIIDRLLLK